jgi:hypothetical protein
VNANDSLAAYLGDDAPTPIPRWIWGLAPRGKPVLVAVACLAARAAYALLDAHRELETIECFTDSSTETALAAAEAWLAAPDDERLSAVRDATVAAEQNLSRIEVYAEETSGSAELCEARDRALAAATACVLAAKTAGWIAEDMAPGLDSEEAQARLRAGPALEASRAVLFTQRALGAPEEELKRLLPTIAPT